jgi:hypothetical protein
VLAATLAECSVEVLDEIVQMFTRRSRARERARRKREELLTARRAPKDWL